MKQATIHQLPKGAGMNSAATSVASELKGLEKGHPIELRPILPNPLVVVAPSDHPLAHQKKAIG